MDRKSTDRRLNPLLPLLLVGGLAFALPMELVAQVPVDEYGEPLEALDPFDYTEGAGPAVQSMNSAELEELVGPIALYPDDLLAIVLPASTYPLEIVQAARFLDELGQDSSLKPDESWDESVIALLNYPEVVYLMDKEIDWTWRLGEAVINQQPEVLAAVESFRDRAYAAGNLESDERQTVSNDDGIIEIAPADEEIIYVPYYEPDEVVVYQPRRRVYYYYPHAYPVYNYPYPVGYSFASGYFWGVTTAYTIGWSNRYLHVYHPSYWGHPYYGRYYYGHYYRRPSISVYNNWYVHNSYRSERHRHRDGDHWRPRKRSGARPASRTVQNRHYRPDGGDNHRSARRQAYADRDATRRNATNDNARTRTDIAANRTRQSTSGNRTRTAAANRDANRTERRERSDIRFRDRADANRNRADRSSDSGRSSANATRQRLVSQNSRQTSASSRTQPGRQASQRNSPARPATVTRTSSRNTDSQRPASRPNVQRQAPTQRPASRPNVQRQAPAQRPASRPNVQRQAPPQRPASRPNAQRQSSGHQQSSGRRGGPRNRDRRN
jgi:hypothetical protein